MNNERGASALETAIILPVLVLAMLAGFELWKLAMLKRALYVGTYQAARYLSNYEDAFSNRLGGGGTSMEERARRFIEAELDGTRFYAEPMVLEEVHVEYGRACVDIDPRLRCGGYQVTVTARLRVPIDFPRLFGLETPPAVVVRGICEHDPCNACSR